MPEPKVIHLVKPIQLLRARCADGLWLYIWAGQWFPVAHGN